MKKDRIGSTRFCLKAGLRTFRFWLWLIRVIGVIVPRRLRADWRREWEAELRHREELLAEWDRLDWRAKLDLLRRSTSAFWDGLWLQPKRLEDEMFQDLRFGVRMLLKSKGFTAVAVLSLALGIGANTAIFSVIDAAMLRALPVERPEQLVLFSRFNPQGDGASFTYPQFEQFRERNQVFASVFGFAYRQPRVNIGGSEEAALVQLASGHYFSALGIQASLGQTFTPSIDRASGDRAPGAVAADEQVAVISDSFWRRKFSRDPATVGKSVTINGSAFNIIGVTPPGFFGVSLDYVVDVWLPLTAQPLLDAQSELSATGRNWVRVMARLKPEVSLEQATADSDLIFHQHLRSVNAPPEAIAQKVGLTPGGRPVSDMRQFLSQPLLMLMAIVVLVLLIACANLANLLLARAASRQREIAVRLALGASRFRLIRQLVTESMMLAILGAAVGLFVGKLGSDLLLALTFKGLALGPLPLPLTFRLDLRLLGFTIMIALVAGILFGLTPALRATKPDLAPGLKENSSQASGHRRRRSLNRFLVAAQLAASLVLLITAGLFVRSFQKLANVELGFNPQVVQVRVTPPPNYTAAQRDSVCQAVEEKISTYPGVVSASASLPGLFGRMNFYTTASVEGEPPRRRPSRDSDKDVVFFVKPGFFSTLGMPLLLGRDFGPQDQQNSVKVVIINEAMRRRLFPNRNPMGQRLTLGGSDRLEVVGVAPDAKYNSVLADAPAMLYLPLAQEPNAFEHRFFEVRTTSGAAGFAAHLQQALQKLDGNLLVESRPLADLVGQSLALQRLIARLTGLFGLLGLTLACVGVYGIMSYTVAQRTGEMGIRLALGAQRRDIIRLVLGEAMLPALGGVAIGLAGALGATRLVASQLFGLASTDPVTISLATLLMVAVASLAAYFPARKASLVEPTVALKYE
jgi:predicted permease